MQRKFIWKKWLKSTINGKRNSCFWNKNRYTSSYIVILNLEIKENDCIIFLKGDDEWKLEKMLQKE